jgi:protein-S-isoprenylcysteine O-methyltransferase Ste14
VDWLVFAIVLALLAIAFRVGVSTRLVHWMREDGKPNLARVYATFLVLIGSGMVLGIVGAFTGVKTLRVTGYLLMGCAFLWLVWLSMRQGQRQKNR